jgi:hypothetical protein
MRGNKFRHETDLLYEQTSLGIRKKSRVFDARLRGDMHLPRVDPLMFECMYVVEAVVQQPESLALSEAENKELMEGIVYIQVDGLVDGRAVHSCLAPNQCSGGE